ncbi:MAG: DUF3307 domain-containing protein [Pseudomonadota bacterium]
MLETLLALIFAHLVGDFLLQSDWMVARKSNPRILILHVALHLVATAVVLGHMPLGALAVIGVTHYAIDWLKERAGGGIGPFLVDQVAHFSVLIGVAALWPALFHDGAWAEKASLPSGFALVSGLIAVLVAGRYATETLLRDVRERGGPSVASPAAGAQTAEQAADGSLTTGITLSSGPPLDLGGLRTGFIERGAVFGLILCGMPLAAVLFAFGKLGMTVLGIQFGWLRRAALAGSVFSLIWGFGCAGLTAIALERLGS